jgi:hypothetical protein
LSNAVNNVPALLSIIILLTPPLPPSLPPSLPTHTESMKQLQTLVRQGRKVLANMYLREILTTRDTCFFFQPPSMNSDTTLDMKQKFRTQAGLTWRYISPGVSQHYLKDSPYKALDRLMQGPILVAYPEEIADRTISTRAVLGLAKEFNLGVLGAKWRNNFLSASELKELKSEGVYRGEVLSLFANYQRTVVQALNMHHEKETGTGPAAEGGEGEGEGGKKMAAAAAAEGGSEAPPSK